jgi:hypothetical protein
LIFFLFSSPPLSGLVTCSSDQLNKRLPTPPHFLLLSDWDSGNTGSAVDDDRGQPKLLKKSEALLILLQVLIIC